jgi:hypothetical protein
MRRMMLAMSQQKLADGLGLTFQQVAFFFKGAPNASAPRGFHRSALSIAQIDDFVSDSNGLRLIGAFMRIDNAHLRRKIVMLVQEIAGDDGN